MNQFEKAINLYNKAIYSDDKYFHAFNNKGYLYLFVRINSFENSISIIGIIEF